MSLVGEMVRANPEKGIMLTIGVFDGVHLGHKYLISELKALAGQDDLLSGAVTFRQHPEGVLLPQTITPSLTTLEARVALLRGEGVDEVVVLSFTRELAETGARQFVSLLQENLDMRGLVVGPDFALGRNREGNVATLRSLGQEMGFTVAAVPPLITEDGVVSSTAIRNALAAGDMERANRMMGRSFSVGGRVVPGTHRGVELGFPTANVEVGVEQALPLDGVYATWVYVNGAVYQAMTNIGKNPTFGGEQRTVEVHLLDYQGDLYGRELKIDFMERVRSERQFATADDLKQQIAADLEQGRAIFGYRGGN